MDDEQPKPACVDYRYAMTPEQHAMLHISEKLMQQEDRIRKLESAVKSLIKQSKEAAAKEVF